jgi:gliding motility-associated protein GldC
MKNSEIKFHIELDENSVPEKIIWETSDAEGDESKECKSFILSIWDSKEKNALRLDLWTKDMNIDDMNIFFFETFITLADTFEKSTGNINLAVDIRRFAREFGEKSGIIQRSDPDAPQHA